MVLVVLAWLLPATASAHSFGAQYSLPLPVSAYMWGGAAALIASCVIFLFTHRDLPKNAAPRYRSHITGIALVAGMWASALTLALGNAWVAVALATVVALYWRRAHIDTAITPPAISPSFARSMRYIASALVFILFFILLCIGFFGPRDPYQNLLVNFFWIGLVLVVPYLSILVGSGWLRALFVPRLAQRTRTWPDGDYTPALVAYSTLIVLELFLQSYGTDPRILAGILLVYGGSLAIGSMRYGASWILHAEVISVFASLAGRLAPFQNKGLVFEITSPAERLSGERFAHISLCILILIALAATAYDGLRETIPWVSIVNSVPFGNFYERSFLGFVLLTLSFCALYAGTLLISRRLAQDKRPLLHHLLRFAPSLVPIMIAYHFAHYCTLILTTGLPAFALLSDPFGTGLNLFGTAQLALNFLPDAQSVWEVQLATIVGGHIVAAYVAHRITLMEYASDRRAFLSEIPLIMLMVAYTAFGLWILGQPFAPTN